METKLGLKIAQKLAIGFGIVMFAVLFSNFFIYRMLKKNKEITEKISKVYTPAVANLNELLFIITNSKILTRNWVVDNLDNTPNKKKLHSINSIEYPKLKKQITTLSTKFNPEEQIIVKSITEQSDILFSTQKDIMDRLSSFDKYNDPYFDLKYNPIIDNVINIADSVIVMVDSLRVRRQIIVTKSNAEMDSTFESFSSMVMYIGLLLTIAILLIGFFTSQSLITPLRKIKNIIVLMGKGAIPNEKLPQGKDEIGQMGVALNELINGLKDKSTFALEIGSENYESEFAPLSKIDALGNSLLRMRENLVKASEEAEIRRIENAERSWSSQGLAEFSEIVRNESNSLENFSSQVISKLTKYMDSSLGGLFVLNKDNEQDVYLELISFYAYDREKFLKKRIEIGENLVGQCVLENETIYMTDIPKGYVNISSGLGRRDPKSLLIVPLKLNNETYGVVELASFEEIKPYQIEFVEKIGETIASTLANIRINLQTAKLLEESKEKSDRLAIQEEINRKNIQRLEAAQEDMINREKDQSSKFKKIEEEYRAKIALLEKRFVKQENDIKDHSIELQSVLVVINNSIGKIEIDYNGEILSVNSEFLKIAEISLVEVLGKPIEQFMYKSVLGSEKYRKFWSDLRIGKNGKVLNHYLFGEKEKWFQEAYTPIKSTEGNYTKIIILAYDYTKFVELEQNVARLSNIE